MKALLRIIGGSKEKGVIDLETGSYKIGRDEKAEIRIDSRQVSRNHAQLMVDKNHVRLVDLGSANGVLVNGRTFASGPLYDGDKIQVGDVTFEYEPKRKPELSSLHHSAGDALTVRKTTIKKTIGGQKSQGLSLRMSLTVILSLLMGGFVLFAGFSFKAVLRNRLENESLKHAAQAVRYLAEKNREDLRLGNELLLDVEGIRKEKGVKDVLLINAKGRIISPMGRMGQTENDPFTIEALAQQNDKSILPSPPFEDGSIIFVHPIRAYNDKAGAYENIGVAKIVFSPAAYVGPLREISHLIFSLLALSILFAMALSWWLSEVLTQPLSALASNLKRSSKESVGNQKIAPFREWATLFRLVEGVLEEKKG